MPIFEYTCGTCGHRFEDLESIADRDKPRDCPKCGSGAVERQVSVFAAKAGGTSSSPSCGHSGGT